MFDNRMNVSDLDKASWIVTAYLIAYASILPLAGRISDAFGHARVFIIGNLIFMGASAFIAVTDDFNLMIAARVFQAIGGGATVPAGMAIIADTFPGKNRPIAFGFLSASVEGGAAIGPTFGGAVTEYLSWRWIFWLDVIIGAVVIILIFLMIKNSPRVQHKIDYQGGLLIAIALVLLSFGLSQQLHRPNAELYMTIYLIASAVTFGLFILRLKTAPEPLFRPSIFRHMRFSAANATHLLIGGALVIALVIVPVMGYTLMELGDVDVGLRLLRLTLAMAIGAIIGGLMCRQLGYRFPTIIGLILSSTGLFLMSRWTLDIAEPDLTLHLIIAGLGFGLVISPIATAAINSVTESEYGIASALVMGTRMIGMVIGLAFMNMLGMGHFHVTAADISIDEFAEELTPFALGLFQDFFLAAAIVCLIAIIPALWMKGKQQLSYS